MKKLAVVISPNYKDYAKKYLNDCLASLRAQTYKEFDIFLVDNESTLETCLFLQMAAPEATVIPLEKNEGFAGGNNAALKVVIEKGYDYAFLINMDAVAEVDCLEKLVNFADKNPQLGAIQPRLMLWPEKDLINSLGNETHFLGFGYCNAYKKKFDPTTDNLTKAISYASGAGVLYRVSALKQVGLFDEVFWMYNEDQDICLRMWFEGFPVYVFSEAVVYHKYEFNRSIKSYYWLDRNRILILLKYYHWLTLILIKPAALIMELGLLMFSIKNGYLKEKLRVWVYLIKPSTWRYIFAQRKVIQPSRKMSDLELLKLFTGEIAFQELASPLLKLANVFLKAYWQIIRFIIFW
ncbi:MAG: glycosyltransferase family 2 protein [Candidatus Falkowbacteria bacterium]|nr:glycosyltransferase family 2 protein [Candidatus Falkowbacteria bacterium]